MPYDTYGQYENASQLARMAHHDQVDKAGRPYLTHVSEVSMRAEDLYLATTRGHLRYRDGFRVSAPSWTGMVIATIGLLHDIVEDTPVTFELLRHFGFDEEVIEGVRSVTRSFEGGTERTEPYKKLIQRAANHHLGKWVKLSDVEDHLVERKGFELPERLRKRYEAALPILKQACGI